MIQGPVWNEKLSVKVREIDDQHKELFRIINHTIRLYESGSLELLPVFRELVEYMGYHFNAELSYMAEYDYPFQEKHHREHQKFTEKVLLLLDAYEASEEGIARKLIVFQKKWPLNHILKTDLAMGEYISGKKAQGAR